MNKYLLRGAALVLALLCLSSCDRAAPLAKEPAAGPTWPAPAGHRTNVDMKERQRIAAQMFAERCKKAGVFIHRTVENVDGIFLMKVRSSKVNYGNQYEMDDPYGSDLDGDGYIGTFLKGMLQTEMKGSTKDAFAALPKGYSYVEAIDTKYGVQYRYTGKIVEPWQTDKSYLKGYEKFVLEKTPIAKNNSRHGLTYDDISTKEERNYWIAGSSLRVIDLQTNEVLAERIGYMVDWAQGATSGGRSPWLLAANNSCPSFGTQHASRSQLNQATKFVQQVLIPSQKN